MFPNDFIQAELRKRNYLEQKITKTSLIASMVDVFKRIDELTAKPDKIVVSYEEDSSND